jgi:hypothetical protein
MNNLTRHFTAFLTLIFLGTTTPVLAISSRAGSAEDLGIGAAVGQPMGATAKYWMSSTTAVDAFAGYHFDGNFDLHADYLWHSFSSFQVSQGRLPFYLGLGGRVNLGDDSHFGMRLPLGISYLFSTDPLEAFLEIAPVVKLVPDIDADVDGMIGLRVYLNYLK